MKTLPATVQKFLSDNSLATIATISEKDDYPYVLPVFYVTDDSSRLYFASHKESKKLQNIVAHPHIGIAITNPVDLISLQLQGTASVAEQNTEIIKKVLVTATEKSGNEMAPIMQLANPGAMLLITFTIHWYRLARYEGENPLFIEGTLE